MWLFNKQLKKYKEQIVAHAGQLEELKAEKRNVETTLLAERKKLEIEFAEKESRLNLKIEEIKQLHKLDIEQQVATIKNDYTLKLVNEKEKLNTAFYEKMSTELAKIHSDGNVQTKFIQELSLKMLDKAPMLPAPETRVNIKHTVKD